MGETFTGSEKKTTKLPAWYENQAKKILGTANRVSQTGYVPFIGPDKAAFNPQQVAGMQSASDWGSAFGMNAPQNILSTLPQSEQFAGGMQGYSSHPMYAEALKKLEETYPGLYKYLKSFSIDPQTGEKVDAAPPVNKMHRAGDLISNLGFGGGGQRPISNFNRNTGGHEGQSRGPQGRQGGDWGNRGSLY